MVIFRALAAVVGLMLALLAAPAAGAPNGDEADLIAEMQAFADAEITGRSGLPRHPWSGATSRLDSQTLQPHPDAWVVDNQQDALNDSNATPELVSAHLAVSKAQPGTLLFAGVTSSSTAATDTFGVLLDVDADGVTDYGTAIRNVELGKAYRLAWLRVVGGNLEPTGREARVVRVATGYALTIDGWRSLGMTDVAYRLALRNAGGIDYAPNAYARPVLVGSMVPPWRARPGKVTKLRVKAKRTKAVVRWRRAARVSYYEVRVLAGSRVVTGRVTGPACVVRGLRPGRRYTVKVRAANDIGKGSVRSKRFRTLGGSRR